MRIHSTLTRSILALTLAGVAAGLAPAAEAQTLAPVVGDPVTYRVSLPEGWYREQEDEMLYVVSDDEEFVILVAAQDLVGEADEPLPFPEPEARRFLTTMLMASDSLLIGLIEQGFLSQSDFPISEMVQELGTLGGERAAHMSARIEIEGEEGWFRIHVTVKDGVMYMLGFMGKGEFQAEQAQLIDRIHESFVLADAPPPLPPRARPGKGGS